MTDKPGYYVRTHIENDKPISEKNLYCSDFWLPIFKDTDFKEYLQKKYTYTSPLDIEKERDALLIMDNKSKPQNAIEEITEDKKTKKKNSNI
jgi:hypothetical protein